MREASTANGQVVARSVARKINGERVVLLGWGRAILLQFAHPLVAAGVADHSEFSHDLRGYVRRTHGTIGAMLGLTFGSEDDVRAVAAKINRIHDRVHGTLRDATGIFPTGTPYSARDPQLLRWVHATLLDSVPLTYERFVGPLTPEEKDRYCAEATVVEQLLGIPGGMLPTTIAERDTYLEEMYESGAIVVSDTARALAAGLLSPPLGVVGRPLIGLARLATIGLLPPPIRRAYGFAWDEAQERALRRAAGFLRRVRPLVPRILRQWPAARVA